MKGGTCQVYRKKLLEVSFKEEGSDFFQALENTGLSSFSSTKLNRPDLGETVKTILSS